MSSSPVNMLALFLIWGWATALAGQQTVHLVLTANNYSGESIRKGCQLDRANTIDLFMAIDELACAAGYDLSVAFHYPTYGKQAVVDYLSTLPATADDAVVFVYSGHGLRDPAGGDWPTLYYCREPTDRIDYVGCGLPLEQVHELLRNKGVRMSIALASSCNHDPLKEAHEQLVSGAARNTTPPSGLPAIHHGFGLFTAFRGHILASASKAGQQAYLTDERGSFFIQSFLHALVDGLVAQEGGSWSEIMRSTRARTVPGEMGRQEAQFLLWTED